MRERLYAALAQGPLLNCRPHNSRQRICLSELGRLEGPQVGEIPGLLLGESGKVHLSLPKGLTKEAQGSQRERDPVTTLWNKLSTIVADAASYEKETGVQALYLGYPLLTVPPLKDGKGGAFGSKRVIAPLAFIPVNLAIRRTRPPSLTLEASGDGAELVIANQALLAWAQQVTGTRTDELFVDEAGAEPWREINEIVSAVCQLLQIPLAEAFSPISPVVAVPKGDEDEGVVARVVNSAVLGLFPLSNQGILRDIEALVGGEPARGPIVAFLDAKAELGALAGSSPTAPAGVGDDRAITEVDPCQRRALLLARSATGLIVHGPPGTGKSQTIANVVSDHLALGKRVLFVCDKRTALDVVEARLRRQGLEGLCAVVHDARRDEKELYRSLREQLDGLDQTTPGPSATEELSRADLELKRLSAELSVYVNLGQPGADGAPSFQELLGRWLEVDGPEALRQPPLKQLSYETLESGSRQLKELFERGLASRYPENPWARGCELGLSQYLSVPPQLWDNQLAALGVSALALDAISPTALPLLPGLGLEAQRQARQNVVSLLAWLLQQNLQGPLAFWAAAEPQRRQRESEAVLGLLPVATSLCASPGDPELHSVTAQQPLPNAADLLHWSQLLTEYLATSDKWYGPLCIGAKGSAKEVLARYGLVQSAPNARRILAFLEQSKQRRRLFDWYQSLHGATAACPTDHAFLASLEAHRAIFSLTGQVTAEPLLAPLSEVIIAHLRESTRQGALLGLLQDSCARAEQLMAFEHTLSQATVVGRALRDALRGEAFAGRPVMPRVALLQQWQHTLENVLRIEQAIIDAPGVLQAPIQSLLRASATAEQGYQALERACLEGQLAARLATEPWLQTLDDGRLVSGYARYRELLSIRQQLSRRLLLGYWLERQRQRLLAGNGGRLNSLGAELRRRFVSRGEKAMRLRQAILSGNAIEGGDPLFDLRPVWLASPEATAQIFPRCPIFDLVVFDEASQCRIEEALPVLLRGQRVLIAGDPQQLPPTRFFESQAAVAEEDEVEDGQELFERQQSEVEDLLSAALNLSIEQAYLDVHYRSQNADLIEFSNVHFYNSRLVPLPLHPSRCSSEPPITLTAVGGIYEQRVNLKEAEAAVSLVRRLLDRAEPPSIGIACFNLGQRDAIIHALDDAAEEDAVFAERLELAKTRQGEGAFEGLFVKNLENVQGDERDHIIVSTTYGPDPAGRFYRRFGPLAQAGGGRRLNVLFTRARQHIHLLTSIPPEAYRTLPPVEAGTKPNGGWLLLSYLSFAEALAKKYEAAPAAQDDRPLLGAKRPILRLASRLQQRLSAQGFVVMGPWGTAGLGADLEVSDGQERSLLLECDVPRYERATDPLEWDVFRHGVLNRQGFTLSRVLSPRLLRDFDGELGRATAPLRTVAK